MSTTATAARVAPTATAITKHDRMFYGSLAVFMAITVLVGFAPTYDLRSFGAPATVSGATSLSLLTQVHGALFTAWVLPFVVQTALVAQRRVAVHRRVGVAGLLATDLPRVPFATCPR